MAVIKIDNKNFQKEIVDSDTPVIIDFFADWCAPCRMMAPVFEEISGEYSGKLKFAKLNTDNSPELAARFNIMGIPCLIVTQDGEEVDRIVGFAPKAAMKQKIDSILKEI